eukprot:CAMPEP_0201667094 /NCGR_PEP_ID=MMETSP0494-20130426/11726_1 /ASSEMBLY_ACC=CAM_ASM_000839 /TAXON_ID=420259 /ORGANISM="Thalassiosira gravida, Strain GMp14c1" /LENGTH=80 /DNA_ID=CAMNT_0048146789 /DNA_START=12 /DNA_END=252 /DNA_ORIENTATION=-
MSVDGARFHDNAEVAWGRHDLYFFNVVLDAADIKTALFNLSATPGLLVWVPFLRTVIILGFSSFSFAKARVAFTADKRTP